MADGRFAEAWELPPPGARRTRRSMEAPEERFAALLGGRGSPLAAEELVLRARADLDAGRTREAALQARVALEALLAELESPARRRAWMSSGRRWPTRPTGPCAASVGRRRGGRRPRRARIEAMETLLPRADAPRRLSSRTFSEIFTSR